MKWIRGQPQEVGWYWFRAQTEETPIVERISRDDDGDLVVGFDKVEGGVHYQRRKLKNDQLVHPNAQWSDNKIAEPD